jgi:hypothetical protein
MSDDDTQGARDMAKILWKPWMNCKGPLAGMTLFLVVAAPLLTAAPVAAAPVTAAPVAATPTEESVDQAIDRALGDHSQYRLVIGALKRAVADHDAAKLAELVDYPLRVTLGGQKTRVRSGKEFVARYAQIITPAIQKVVTEQRYADLFVNSEGVMFGRGELWLRGICKDPGCRQVEVKIVTIQNIADLDDQKTH